MDEKQRQSVRDLIERRAKELKRRREIVNLFANGDMGATADEIKRKRFNDTEQLRDF